MSITTAQKRTRYTWSKDAERLVQKAQNAANPGKNVRLLHEQLEQITGFNSRVCWAFLERNGFQRPSAGTYKRWDPKILDYVLDHGYDKAAERYRCDKQRLYAFVKREGRQVGQGTDYSIRTFSRLLQVRSDQVERWIANGQLEGNAVLFRGKQTWRISGDQLKKFLLLHGKPLIGSGRRVPAKRLAFLEEFLYEGKHMDLQLLHTRESKKENDAFANGEYRIASPPRSVSDAGRPFSSDLSPCNTLIGGVRGVHARI